MYSFVSIRRLTTLSVLLALPVVMSSAQADEELSPAVKLLKSGRIPDERLPRLIETICESGSAQDLGVIYSMSLSPAAFSPATRLKSLEALSVASSIRKLKPTGDLAEIKKFVISSESPQLQLAATRLASEWKVTAVTGELQRLAEDAKTPENLRHAALDGLMTMGSPEARQTLSRLTSPNFSLRLRILAAAGLAAFDLDEAAAKSAEIATQLGPKDNPSPLLNAFLTKQGGSAKLAKAIAAAKLKPDVAKIILRSMYSSGHSEPDLADVLSAAAGIAANPAPPTAAELEQLVAEVHAKGDAARGEAVFRRNDVSCMKCHSVARAGGVVGPDLSPIGSTSPVDYVANSILQPSLAIKEQYLTKIIATADGKVVTGILVDRNDQQVRLRDANGTITQIAVGDIDDERDGRSLMPEGLTRFLTHEELVDLIKFVSELGKPGPYQIRTTPSIQRWRVLRDPPSELIEQTPNLEMVRIHLLEDHPENWIPAYGRVGGVLPLSDLVSDATKTTVVYLQGEIKVTTGGELSFSIKAPGEFQAWIDADPISTPNQYTQNLEPGLHKLTLRVATQGGVNDGVMVEVSKPDTAETQFEVVSGP